MNTGTVKTICKTGLLGLALGISSFAAADNFNLGNSSGYYQTGLTGYVSNTPSGWFAAGNVDNILVQTASFGGATLFEYDYAAGTGGNYVNFLIHNVTGPYGTTGAAVADGQYNYGTGAYLDLYVDTAGPTDFSTLNASAYDGSNFVGVTDTATSTLLARFEVVTDMKLTWELNQFGGGVGSNTFYMNCIAGSACGGVGNGQSVDFDTDGFFGLFDKNAQFDFVNVPNLANGWEFGLTDPGTGYVTTPEPGVLLMFATGLFGLVGLSRRKKAKLAA